MTRGLILAGAVVFVLAALGIGRILAASADERGAIERLVTAEGRGDVPAVRRLVTGCAGGCRALVARLERRGTVQVLRMDPSTRFALGGVAGTTRVAWKAAGPPVAQCVRVRRRGDVVSGFASELVVISRPISIEKGCPGGG